MISEDKRVFENRKREHIRLSLDSSNEALGKSGLDNIQLIHEALPDLDFQDVQINSSIFGNSVLAPFYVASMTAGHEDAIALNVRIAQACQKKSWVMGVGSQRRQLFDDSLLREWGQLKEKAPDVLLMGNIGISQLIKSDTKDIQKLVDSIGAFVMNVHLNSLQEVLQIEGTPQFKGCFDAIKRLSSELSVPVIVKETGCGFSKKTLEKLNGTGISAVDLSGFGGTHWGRIEGSRSSEKSILRKASKTFANWGVSTLDSLLFSNELDLDYQIWASGGLRSGLDAAKCIAMGANLTGFARPILQAAMKSEEELERWMETVEYELKISLFCTGYNNIKDFQTGQIWKKI